MAIPMRSTDFRSIVEPILNEEFGEKPEDVEYARKVIDLDEKASAAGRASFELDGKMIDIPIVERARKTIARFEKHAAQHAARARARHPCPRPPLPPARRRQRSSR